MCVANIHTNTHCDFNPDRDCARIAHSHCDSYGATESYTNRYGYSYGYIHNHAECYGNSYSYGYCEAHAHGET